MIQLGQVGRLLPWHSGTGQGFPERAHAPLPVGLEPEEAHADLHRNDRRPGHQHDEEAVPLADHHSSPSRLCETAFAIRPPRFRVDMYCSVRAYACTSDIPLSFSVL